MTSAARVGGFGSELGLYPVVSSANAMVLAPSRHAEYEHHPPQKKIFLWSREKAHESAILSGPHAVQQLGRHLRVALKDLDFAAG